MLVNGISLDQCSEVEYKEANTLPERTGGLGWSKKDYRYAFQIFKVERCDKQSRSAIT